MAIDPQTLDALDPAKLDLPVDPRVVRMHVEEMTNFEGEPSLRVVIVLPDETDFENVDGGALNDIKMAIRDRLNAIGEERFPYTKFYGESDWEEQYGETSCTTT